MSNRLLVARLGGPVPIPVVDGVRVTVRPVRPGDTEEVAAVYHAAYDGRWSLREALNDIVGNFAGRSGALVNEASLVAVHGGSRRVLGAVFTVTGAPWPDTPQGAFVIDLFVSRHFRRQGIARALMLAAMSAAPGDTIHLRVGDDNVAARRLYESLGFTDTGS
jgi:ribosomal protein S18 acetylase RimI-like enzyme